MSPCISGQDCNSKHIQHYIQKLLVLQGPPGLHLGCWLTGCWWNKLTNAGMHARAGAVTRSCADLLVHTCADTHLHTLSLSLTHTHTHSGVPELGTACRQLFLIDFDSWTFINHGAFGGVCCPAHSEAAAWREHCERQPLAFLDRWSIMYWPLPCHSTNP